MDRSSNQHDTPDSPEPATLHASGYRSTPEEIQTARRRFRANDMAVALLDAIPDGALVLNENRQIVAANSHFLSQLGLDGVAPILGLRPGEAVKCVHSFDCRSGCGTSAACRFCGAVNAVVGCLASHKTTELECQILTSGSPRPAFDLLVRATYVEVDDMGLVLMVLRDISARKRRRVLERIFLHDVLNSIGGIYGLASILRETVGDGEDSDYADDIYRLSALVLDEIRAHHKLILAESGELRPDPAEVTVAEIVQDVVATYSRHEVADGRQIVATGADHTKITTDPVLLRRVLGNLFKNALEATDRGHTVTLAVSTDPNSVTFAIHNDESMSEEALSRVFQISFSTKAKTGRGLGTYSARMFCEGPLHGAVVVHSTPEAGTTFTVRIPRSLRQDVS